MVSGFVRRAHPPSPHLPTATPTSAPSPATVTPVTSSPRDLTTRATRPILDEYQPPAPPTTPGSHHDRQRQHPPRPDLRHDPRHRLPRQPAGRDRRDRRRPPVAGQQQH